MHNFCVWLDATEFSSYVLLNLSGMEGGPLFGEHAHFIGILIRPLRQKNSGAEIQVICKDPFLIYCPNCLIVAALYTTVALGNS